MALFSSRVSSRGRAPGRAPAPWIQSPAFDLLWISGPLLLTSATLIVARPWFDHHHGVGPWAWLVLVVCVDVAHVYASLFRTYSDPKLEQKALLWVIPLSCWGLGVLLYSQSSHLFWTGLAYLAVFHFVRQQYGFAMIYSRFEKSRPKWSKRLDQVTIYAATLYPLVDWHAHLPRNFFWFIEGDFLTGLNFLPMKMIQIAYVMILLAYLAKESFLCWQSKVINWPRNLWILGTALSWYLGIVWLNNDLAFTFSNVVNHGIPYVALIWLYGHRSWQGQSGWRAQLFRWSWLPIFVGTLLLLAYLEEGLWDGLIWRDHQSLFPSFADLPSIKSNLLLSLVVPLLALPQSTHYLFDAFLWRTKGPDSRWKTVVG